MAGGQSAGDAASGRVAIAIAVVAVASIAALVVFYTVGGPFGSINDAGNGLIGILSGLLAILLHGRTGTWPGVVAALAGAAVAVGGSWLVMTGTTGFVLAGFVSTIGFGLIGVWLALIAWPAASARWSSRVRMVARVGSASMVIGGIAAVPGALMGIDGFEALPPGLWLFSLGWLGTYLLYPIWSFAFGRMLTRCTIKT